MLEKLKGKLSEDLDSLRKLLVEELRDLASAEEQIIDFLPQMENRASETGLRQALAHHLEESKAHLRRLEDIFKKLQEKRGSEKCLGMDGLIKEAKIRLGMDGKPPVVDAALISSMQRMEHYEIAGYGCASEFARLLGKMDIVAILELSLSEEKKTDSKLSRVAMDDVNLAAMEA